MVTAVADTTGVDEGQARLYITEDAVRSWASTLENGDAVPFQDDGLVAIPGPLALHLLSWSGTAMQMLINGQDEPNESLEAALDSGEMIALNALPHPASPFDALEVAVRPEVFDDLCIAVDEIAHCLNLTPLHDLALPPSGSLPSGADDEDVANAVAGFGREIRVALETHHRHINDLSEILSYGSLPGLEWGH